MSTSLALNLPSLDAKPANPSETRTAQVKQWLAETTRRDPIEAAQLIGDALAATNRVAMSDSRRLELAEIYWVAAAALCFSTSGLSSAATRRRSHAGSSRSCH